MESVDLHKTKIPREILSLVPEPIARRHGVIAFDKKDGVLDLAMIDPEDLQIKEFIKKTTGLEVEAFPTTKESIDLGLTLYRDKIEEEFKKILGGNELAAIAEQIPVIEVVDTLLEYAIFEKASDIHIEPEEGKVAVRYRIDGMLHEVMSLPKIVLSAVVARIKVLSNLKIDEHRLPQDGRFKKELDGNKVSFRVSTIPVFDGEKVELRLLDESAKPLTLEELGLQSRN